MSFNDYWEAKAAKRRKAWAAKAKHFAEKHMQLEDIRSELISGNFVGRTKGAKCPFDLQFLTWDFS